mmetsp:Transcript_40705/g.117802  ORF Transcript_40705/g.117802 Transcript_40705/m.117802 type:complete len:266 (+) Transcript_40705:611-1408(+)
MAAGDNIATPAGAAAAGSWRRRRLRDGNLARDVRPQHSLPTRLRRAPSLGVLAHANEVVRLTADAAVGHMVNNCPHEVVHGVPEAHIEHTRHATALLLRPPQGLHKRPLAPVFAQEGGERFPAQVPPGTMHEHDGEFGEVRLHEELCVQVQDSIAHQVQQRRNRGVLAVAQAGLHLLVKQRVPAIDGAQLEHPDKTFFCDDVVGVSELLRWVQVQAAQQDEGGADGVRRQKQPEAQVEAAEGDCQDRGREEGENTVMGAVGEHRY